MAEMTSPKVTSWDISSLIRLMGLHNPKDDTITLNWVYYVYFIDSYLFRFLCKFLVEFYIFNYTNSIKDAVLEEGWSWWRPMLHFRSFYELGNEFTDLKFIL